MKLTTKIKRYGNTAVIRLKKEDMERLSVEEDAQLGDFVEVEIKRKHPATSREREE